MRREDTCLHKRLETAFDETQEYITHIYQQTNKPHINALLTNCFGNPSDFVLYQKLLVNEPTILMTVMIMITITKLMTKRVMVVIITIMTVMIIIMKMNVMIIITKQ